METSTATHLVLIPSFNPGRKVYEAVRAARHEWMPVWVVVDGSTDGTEEGLKRMAEGDPGLRVIVLPENRGKGAAVLHGIELAHRQGFTHVLTMNSDGHYPAEPIADFIAASTARPEAMILGMPVSASGERPSGVRRALNWWANVETLWCGIGDALCGFRVYPIAPLLRVTSGRRWMRGFDFDPEVAVRMAWDGVPLVNVPIRIDEGGHRGAGGRGLRDHLVLAWMHVRLLAGFLRRLPRLMARRAERLRQAR